MSLSEVKEYSLSDGDIKKLLPGIKIWTYPQLQNLKNIDMMFDKKGRAIVLHLIDSPNSGHWTCLIKKPTGIEFFDPYGDKPADQLDTVPKDKLVELDESEPFLMNLLKGSGHKVIYNGRQFQKWNTAKQDTSTCGRWCITRLLYAPKTLDEFSKIVDSAKMSPDDFVSGLTYNWLKK